MELTPEQKKKLIKSIKKLLWDVNLSDAQAYDSWHIKEYIYQFLFGCAARRILHVKEMILCYPFLFRDENLTVDNHLFHSACNTTFFCTPAFFLYFSEVCFWWMAQTS